MGALTIFGIAHGNEPEPINLVITTHNPACTAVHLDYLGVTRLTDVKPWLRHGVLGYTHSEITSGVNVTAIVWARDSNVTIPAILERPEVSGVAAYSHIAPNSTEAPMPLAQYDNPDVIRPHMGHPTPCGLATDHILLAMMDDICWGGAAPDATPADRKEIDHSRPGMPATPEPVPPALDAISNMRIDVESGTAYVGDLMGVEIYTSNHTSVWAYLKDNGALVFGAGPGAVAGYASPHVLWPLLMRDDISAIRQISLPVPQHYGAVPRALDDRHTMTYKVVAHYPVCVAIYVGEVEVGVRLTAVREHYNKPELRAGVPMLIRAPEDRAPDVVQSLLERPAVYSVQRVGAFWNGSHTVEWPLHVNPGADSRGGNGSNCYDIDGTLAWEIRQATIQRDSCAFAVSGEQDGNIMHVRIATNNLTSMVAYLEGNGATVQQAVEIVEYEGRLLAPRVIALIPSHIIPALAERGDFRSMETIFPPVLLHDGIPDSLHSLVSDGTVHGIPDTVRPIITLSGPANVTIPLNSPYVEPGYAATDNVDGNITCEVAITGWVNPTTPGTYTISYDVTDGSNNTATTQNRTIHVADVSPPAAALPGPAQITVEDAEGPWLAVHGGHAFGSGHYNLAPERVVKAVRDFVAAYDSEGVAAFETVNDMQADYIYPFAVDAETLKVVAEGAFPQAGGLQATFLHDADRPLEGIMDELRKYEGAWVEYAFHNPRTAAYENKRSYLVMHDGHIFGSGYYTSPDVEAVNAVAAMLRLYGMAGEDAFADMQSIPAGAFNAPFVLDADTLDIAAHANPGLSGSDVRDAMTSGRSLEFAYDMLDRHGSLWLSYPAADPAPGSEYTRAYMLLRDGYVFASGYGMGADARLRSLVDESARLYYLEGEAAFDIITSMNATEQLVGDLQGSTLVASSIIPQHVGNAFSMSSVLRGQSLEGLEPPYKRTGLWTDRFAKVWDGAELRTRTWGVLHDDDKYWFGASRTYSPEEYAVSEVNAAIDLYKTYGEAAFDRITWRSVDPAAVYPFVFDYGTWTVVADAAYPDRPTPLPASIRAEHGLYKIDRALAENGGAWASYKAHNPATGLVEYRTDWLALHDGYVFAAGYHSGSLDRAEGILAGAIANYSANGTAAFDAMNQIVSDNIYYVPLVLDRNTLDVAAFAGYPELVGLNVDDIVLNAHDLTANIGANLAEDGDSAVAVVTFNLEHPDYPKTNEWIPWHFYRTIFSENWQLPTMFVVLQLYDGHVFAVAQSMAYYVWQ